MVAARRTTPSVLLVLLLQFSSIANITARTHAATGMEPAKTPARKTGPPEPSKRPDPVSAIEEASKTLGLPEVKQETQHEDVAHILAAQLAQQVMGDGAAGERVKKQEALSKNLVSEVLGSYSIPPAPPAPDRVTKLMQCEAERSELRKDLSRGQTHLTEKLAKAYKPLLEKEEELKQKEIALQKLKTELQEKLALSKMVADDHLMTYNSSMNHLREKMEEARGKVNEHRLVASHVVDANEKKRAQVMQAKAILHFQGFSECAAIFDPTIVGTSTSDSSSGVSVDNKDAEQDAPAEGEKQAENHSREDDRPPKTSIPKSEQTRPV